MAGNSIIPKVPFQLCSIMRKMNRVAVRFTLHCGIGYYVASGFLILQHRRELYSRFNLSCSVDIISCRMAARVSVPFTAGRRSGGEERPNTELAENSLPVGRGKTRVCQSLSLSNGVRSA
jgi:hypothetical protein